MLGESLVVVFSVETKQQLPPCGCRTTCKQWAYPIILFGVLWCFAPDCLLLVMEEEMQQLRDLLAQLKADNEHLLQECATAPEPTVAPGACLQLLCILPLM